MEPLTPLDELLRRWSAGRSAGNGPTPEELCRDRPDLLDELRQRIRQREVAGQQTVDDHTADWQDSAGAGSTPTPGGDQPRTDVPSRAGRFVLGAEIARGGMGAILRAEDPGFRRALAVKVLLADPRARPDLLERFHEEAQITGMLQHPGVAPVHDMGTLPDGRPFFAMKLIEGRTLTALLRERSHPGDDLPRFLGIFEQICQTVAYAHARGVIHRDLKPANVMVGAFGEVQVMDWGLAKVLGEASGGRPAPLPSTHPGADAPRSPWSGYPGADAPRSPAGATLAGQALGTPAYMAPEQARGEVEELDERCDVFGLGAVLCVFLTGRPPFVGRNVPETLRAAERGDLADAWERLQRCGADPDLVELARRCLAPAKGDRPRNGGEVAAAVTSYREQVQERLRRAEVERAAAEARASEEQRRRRAERQRGLMAVTVMALLLLLGLGVGGAVWWYQADQAARAADEERQRLLADRKQALVEQEVTQAVRAGQEIHARLDAELRQPGGVRALLNERTRWEGPLKDARASWRRARILADGAPRPVPHVLAKQIEALGASVTAAELDYTTVRRLEECRLDTSMVLGSFDLQRATATFAGLLREAGLDLVGGEVDGIVATLRRSAVREELVAGIETWASLVCRRPPERLSPQDQALIDRILLTARQADPDPWRDRFRDPAVWASRRMFKEILAEAPADQVSPQMLHTIAMMLRVTDPTAAEPWLRKAVARHPGDLWLNFLLGTVLFERGHPEALRFYQAAYALRPDSSATMTNLGAAEYAAGNHAAALDLLTRAVAAEPNNARAQYNLGKMLIERNELARAIQLLRRAVELDPEFVLALTELGLALSYNGESRAALEPLKRAIQLDPSSYAAHTNLGAALLDLKEINAAEPVLQSAIKLAPGRPEAYNGLGRLHKFRGDTRAALRAFDSAIKLDPKNGHAYTSRGSLLLEVADYPAAAEALRKAVQLEPSSHLAQINLGHALTQLGDLPGALTAVRAALQLRPDEPHAHVGHGDILLRMGKPAEAKQALVKGMTLLPAGHTLRAGAEALLKECEKQLAARPALPPAGKPLHAFAGELTPKDEFDTAAATRKSHRKVHTARLEKGKAYLLDLRGAFDTFLRVEGPGGEPLLENDDVTPPAVLASRLVFLPPADGVYRLVVTSFQPGATGKYILEVREATIAEQEYTGRQELTGKDSVRQGRHVQSFKVSLSAGVAYVLEVESAAFEPALGLRDPEGKAMLTVSGPVAPGKVRVARLDFTPGASGEYRLEVSTAAPGETGPFTLRVRGYAPAKAGR